jgi:hypothetical protein
MTAQDRAADRDDQQSIRNGVGAMALQSGRGYEAVPQAFVRLTGSYLAKPHVNRTVVTE